MGEGPWNEAGIMVRLKFSSGDSFVMDVYFYLLQRAYSTDPDEMSEKVCVAEWNNCAYTIASLGEVHLLGERTASCN